MEAIIDALRMAIIMREISGLECDDLREIEAALSEWWAWES